MPRQGTGINIQQFYDENTKAHGEIKSELKDLNTAVNNHVSTIDKNVATINVDIANINGKYSNILWLIGVLVVTIAVGIVAKLLL